MHLLPNMGGFGLWIWSAWGCTLVVFALNFVIAYCEERTVRKQIRNTTKHNSP